MKTKTKKDAPDERKWKETPDKKDKEVIRKEINTSHPANDDVSPGEDLNPRKPK